jgi:hypothetical protein
MGLRLYCVVSRDRCPGDGRAVWQLEVSLVLVAAAILERHDMIDNRSLVDAMKEHVASAKSSYFLTTTRAAYETWFRVELAPVLGRLGIPQVDLDPHFNYPGTNQKADLVARIRDSLIVFELKSFVEAADSNKMVEFPKQLRRLEGLLGSTNIIQVIAFVTFLGYSDQRMKGYLERLFGKDQWHVVGPELAVKDGNLFLAVASRSR